MLSKLKDDNEIFEAGWMEKLIRLLDLIGLFGLIKEIIYYF